MSLGDSNPPHSLSGFAAVDTILATDKPLNDVLSCVLQHEEIGIPLVIRGLNIDPNWLPHPELDPPEGHVDGGHRLPGRLGEQPAAFECQYDLKHVIS